MFLLNCALDIIGVENFIRSSSISFQGSTLTVFQETQLLRRRIVVVFRELRGSEWGRRVLNGVLETTERQFQDFSLKW